MTDRVNMSWNDWNSQLEKARADEREKVLSEVLEMVKRQRLSPKDGYFTDERKRHQNSLRAEPRAKLNQLKGIEWVGVFAPNGGHAPPNNPYPLKRRVKYQKSDKPWDYKSNLGKWLSKEIEFSKIDGAKFTKVMVLGTVEFDKDNTIYVLIPEAVFEKYPLNQLKGE